MKIDTLVFLTVFVSLLTASTGFAPVTLTKASNDNVVVLKKANPSSTILASGKLDGITHELEELGQEIKPHLLHQKHGFNEYHESLVHKLRRLAHEKELLHHEALDELEKREKSQTTLQKLMHTLQDIQGQLDETKAYAIAWESTAVNLRNEVAHRQKLEKHNRAIQDLLHTMQHIEKELNETDAYALAWETAELELYREKRSHEQEHESVRRLLGRAIQLSAQRLKNGVKRVLFFWKK